MLYGVVGTVNLMVCGFAHGPCSLPFTISAGGIDVSHSAFFEGGGNFPWPLFSIQHSTSVIQGLIAVLVVGISISRFVRRRHFSANS